MANLARNLVLPLVGAALLSALPGCSAGPQPTAVHGSAHLPGDWTVLPSTDWRIGVLPEPTRAYLESVRTSMVAERGTDYHRFYGRYTDGMLKQIAEANNIVSTAFLTAPKTVNRNLTPELFNTAETHEQADWHFAVNANDDLRGLRNDWGRFWLTDSPSKLSPYPIQSTGGQP
jgi:hypothetical protein